MICKKNKKNNNKNIIDKIKECSHKDKMNLVISMFFLAISFLLDKIVISLVNTIQYPILFTLFYCITLLGETYIFIWIVLFIAIALIINNHTIKKFIITLAVSAISEIILKTIINRPRPFEALQINSTIITNMSSFPSGHAMMFFAMIPILSQKFPKIKIGVWIVAILVALSRIYLGVHYFSDVVAGAIFGYYIGMIILQVGEKNVKKN